MDINGNQIILKASDGSESLIDAFDGLTIDFRGRGSTVILAAESIFVGAKMILGHECKVEIGKTHARGLRNFVVDMSGQGKDKKLVIGDGCSCESMRFAMANESNLAVSLGNNCLISSNVTVRPTDGHSIYELESGKIINRTRPIFIGNNVWIGSGVTFLKGCAVSSNSIVGAGAIVTNSFSEENVIIAGFPAKVVKRGVMWDRRYIEHFSKKNYNVFDL